LFEAAFHVIATTIAAIAEKKRSAIVAMIWGITLQRSLWNAVIATIAEVWFPYDGNDC